LGTDTSGDVGFGDVSNGSIDEFDVFGGFQTVGVLFAEDDAGFDDITKVFFVDVSRNFGDNVARRLISAGVKPEVVGSGGVDNGEIIGLTLSDQKGNVAFEGGDEDRFAFHCVYRGMR